MDADKQVTANFNCNDDNGYTWNGVECVSVCPAGFTWNPITRTCEPAFEVCYRGDIGSLISDPGYACVDKWRAPTSQSEPYWRDAIDADEPDCFRFTNTQSCCYFTTFNSKEYGQYQGVVVKKA